MTQTATQAAALKAIAPLITEAERDLQKAIVDAANYARETANAYSRLGMELDKWALGQEARVLDQDHVARTMTDKMNTVERRRDALRSVLAARIAIEEES